MISDPLPFLRATQSAEGGWGYQPGRAAIVEPTSAVLLALNLRHQEAELHRRAASWLISTQHPDGSWGINAADTQGGWMTAWAVWALAEARQDLRAVEAGVQWLLDEPVLQLSNLDDLTLGEKIAGIDFSLRGWSWQPGEASWVEPTALTILAIVSAGQAEAARLSEAARYLVNRRCPGGGWNVGNPIMFGSYLPARALPTALGLMALAKIAPHAILEEDFAALQATALAEDSAMALAWAVWALAVNGKPVRDLLERLIAQQNQDGSWEANPFTTGIAWLAIQKAAQ